MSQRVKRQTVSREDDIVTDKRVWSVGNDERLMRSNGQRPKARRRISLEPNRIKLKEKMRITRFISYLTYLISFVY